MLIPLQQIRRRGADSDPVIVTIGINPETIEEAEPHADAYVGGDCVKLAVHGDRVLYCTGTVENVVRQTMEAVWGPPRPEACER